MKQWFFHLIISFIFWLGWYDIRNWLVVKRDALHPFFSTLHITEINLNFLLLLKIDLVT
jgi:hypothetical protein